LPPSISKGRPSTAMTRSASDFAASR